MKKIKKIFDQAYKKITGQPEPEYKADPNLQQKRSGFGLTDAQFKQLIARSGQMVLDPNEVQPSENSKLFQKSLDKQEEALGSSLSLGNTQIYTANEEFDADRLGIRTLLGITQNNIDIFGTSARSDYYESKKELATVYKSLSEIEIKKYVSNDWIDAKILTEKLLKYQNLLKLYTELVDKKKIQLENEDISNIDYLEVQNRILNLEATLENLRYNRELAIDNLNSWINDSITYIPGNEEFTGNTITDTEIISHPRLLIKRENINVLKNSLDMQNNRYLPTFNLTYKAMNVQGIPGLHSYQVGVNVPLIFNQVSSRYDSTEKELEITELQYEQEQIILEKEFNKAKKTLKIHKNNFEKSIEIKENNKQLLEAAEISKKSQDISFSDFLSIVERYIEAEISVLENKHKYYKSIIELKYYNP